MTTGIAVFEKASLTQEKYPVGKAESKRSMVVSSQIFEGPELQVRKLKLCPIDCESLIVNNFE